MDPHGDREMSVADTLEFDPQRVRPVGAADTSPAPGFLDTAAAAFRYARDDQTGHTDEERQSAYGPVVTALQERGFDPRRYVNPYGGEPVNYDAVWRDVDAARKNDPDAFKEIGDRATFENGWRSRFAQRQARDAATLQRGGLGATLAGGLVGSLTDPINVGGMVLTGGWGGTSVAGRLLAEAATNAGIEALEIPLTIAEREKQGRELTGEEIALNLGFAAAGGAAFKGAEIGAPKAFAKAWEQMPLDVRAAVALRRAKPDFAMTPDEAAALHVVARGTQIDATNPFAHTYDGLEVHAARIDQTIAAMGQWPAPAAVSALTPARRPSSALPPVSADLDTAWRAIIGIEGGTNRDGSFRTSPAGAIGPAQVMPATAPEAARLAGLPFDERRYRTDAAYNQALGQAYYREMLRQFDGDPVKAAAAYNAGPGSSRKGTGVRGAMARAQRAGVPEEWVSFLPAETRGYVANFRRRTGAQAGELIELTDGETIAPTRPAALDAERPMVDVERADLEIAQDRNSVDLPEIRRDLFASDDDWRAAQASIDREVFGIDPARPGPIDVAAGVDVRQHNRDGEMLPDWERHLEGVEATAERVRAEGDVPLFHGTAGAWREAGDSGLGMTFFAEDAYAASRYAGASGGRRGAGRPGGEGRILVQPVPGNTRILDITTPEGVVALASLPAEGRMAAPIIEAAKRAVDEGDPGRASVQLWQATKNAAGSDARGIREAIVDQLAARGYNGIRFLDDSHPTVALFDEPAPRSAASASPALRDELEAEGLAGPAVADLEAGKVFDDPTGPAVERVADLAWHDAQASDAALQAMNAGIDQVDGALRSIDLVAAAALDRELAEMSRGLPEQLTFDLGDGRGERAFADIEAELKADQDAIATIESCLNPGAMGGAA